MVIRALSILRRQNRIGYGTAAVLALAMVAGGCASDRPARDPSVQMSPSAQVTVRDEDEPARQAAVDPDGYPTFAEPLTAANTQLTDEDAASISARLSALSRARKAGTVSEADYQRQLQILRKLAAQHGVDAEAAIAN
ncbi:SHOCT domain-containing protein [Ciceribacter sp. L1K23]|uniref:SHOCT domain-containing protein n=1 Tax=Ciceribacter sp. L1K23 TaxID=2820276 RepID=UPI001B83AB36|nr:SHOCT domain-containing protein [Ciceribacter sp. L1K23]MBR0555762.1 SHOCT domain-containing protein [Ciceribacter sp. L1K23]